MRIYRSKEERTASGKSLYEGEQSELINRLQAEDILWYMGFEKSYVPITIQNLLNKVTHEKDDKDFLVSCKTFILEAKKVAKNTRITKPVEVVAKPVEPVKETAPVVKEGGYCIQLSENAKNFYIQLAKKNDMTVPAVILKLLEDKAKECMEKAMSRIRQQAMEMAVEEVEL